MLKSQGFIKGVEMENSHWKEFWVVILIVIAFAVDASAITNEVYRVKLKIDSVPYYFTGPVVPEDNGDKATIQVHYYIKGYTDPRAANQYVRIPFSDLRSAVFSKMQSNNVPNVIITKMDGQIIEGIHGYPFCISLPEGATNSGGCTPGKIGFADSTYSTNIIYTGSIEQIERILDSNEISVALQKIDQIKPIRAKQKEIHREEKRQQEEVARQEEQRRVEIEKRLAQEKERQLAAVQQTTERLRKHLKIGDDTNCGLVIEVKPPIVKIQTMNGEYWMRIEQVYPTGIECRFVNGEYQAPRIR